jgi:hypothetical protein
MQANEPKRKWQIQGKVYECTVKCVKAKKSVKKHAKMCKSRGECAKAWVSAQKHVKAR